jgi:hypothetical protein
MASEETPLLHQADEQAALDHDAVYDRFSPSRKRIIAAVTALTGTFPSKLLCAVSCHRKLKRRQCLRQGPSSPSFLKSPMTSIRPERWLGALQANLTSP